MSHAFLFLAFSITLDVAANIILKYSDGFRLKMYGFSAIALVLAAFACLVEAIKTINLSDAYAIWGGLGLVATTLLDYFLFGEKIKTTGWLGLGLITFGVAVLNIV